LFDQAHRVLLEGRRTLRRPTALASELADLAQRAGDWGEAAAEWGRVVTESPAQLPNAVAEPDDAPAGGAARAEGRRDPAPARAPYADLPPPPPAGRARADAARSFLDAGDRTDARAVLERIAADPSAPADAQTLAQAVLLEVLIEDGQLDAATARLAELRDRL